MGVILCKDSKKVEQQPIRKKNETVVITNAEYGRWADGEPSPHRKHPNRSLIKTNNDIIQYPVMNIPLSPYKF